MKRQHQKKDSLEGLIIHLPLAYDGDLADRVTGNTIQLTGDGSMVWDNTYGAYKITSPPTANKQVGFLSADLTPTVFPDNCYTSLVTFRKISTGSVLQSYICLNITTDTTRPALACMYNGTSTMTSYPAEFVKLAMVCDSLDTNLRYFIQDGVLYISGSVWTPFLPSNWRINPTTSGVNLGSSRTVSGYYNRQYCIKDLYLFNRALSLDEIKQIQEIP